MAYIRKRKNSYSVVYRVKNADGIEHQKSESYATQKEAEKRKKEIEYKQSLGTFVVPKCTRVKELVREYVRIYGHNDHCSDSASDPQGSEELFQTGRKVGNDG